MYQESRSIVVESNPMLRESLVMQLEAFGFAVTAAGNSDKALEVIRGAPETRLMLVDSNVAGRTGAFELASIARFIAPDLRVVIACGYSSTPLFGQAASAQWKLLRKPFKRSEFRVAIHDALAA